MYANLNADIDQQVDSLMPHGFLNLDSIPQVHHIKQRALNALVLTGEFFSPTLGVFFGVVPAKCVLFKSERSMLVQMIDGVQVSLQMTEMGDGAERVPLLLVREDGLVFRTPFFVFLSVKTY